MVPTCSNDMNDHTNDRIVVLSVRGRNSKSIDFFFFAKITILRVSLSMGGLIQFQKSEMIVKCSTYSKSQLPSP